MTGGMTKMNVIQDSTSGAIQAVKAKRQASARLVEHKEVQTTHFTQNTNLEIMTLKIMG